MNSSLKENLITTKDASESSGYTSDYLARLVRSGEIIGKRVGHSWLIDNASLDLFLNKQKSRKLDRARELASARVEEYRTHHQLVHRAPEVLTTKVFVPKLGFESSPLRSHLFALSVAAVVVVVGANLARADVLPQIAGQVATIAAEAAVGFTETFGAIPSLIMSRVAVANDVMQAASPRVAATQAIVSAHLASPLLAQPNLSPLRMALGEDHHDRVAVHTGSSKAVAPVTVDDLYASVQGAYAFVTTPSQIVDTLLHSYIAIGTGAYVGIENSLAAYRAVIGGAGATTLALAVTVRDALVTTPHLIRDMNLALGTAIIDLSHAAIRADVAIAYGTASAAPATARTTVAFIGGAGAVLAGAASGVPALATTLYLRATSAPAHLAPALAQAVFGAEYAGATRFVAATENITDTYALALSSLGEAGYTGATGAHALALATLSGGTKLAQTLAHAPAAFEDAYLGTLGKTALALNSIPKVSQIAAAVVPTLSSGEQAALAVYQTIHSFFDAAGRTLASLFEATGRTLAFLFGSASLTPVIPPTQVVVVATSSPASSPTIVQQTVNSYPTYTTVVQGISQDALNQSLMAQRDNILATVASMIQPVATQGVTNMNTIQYVNMIQDLSNLIVRNGSFRGGNFDSGTLTNGISVAATSGSFSSLTSTAGSFTSLSAGTTNIATTTMTGDLTIAGSAHISGSLTIGTTTITGPIAVSGTATLGEIVTAGAFIATSTNATSTFAGSFAIDTNGFVYATSTRNVGIGVLSPAALLAIQNSTSTQPIFIANNAAGTEVYRITNAGFVGIGTTTPGYALAVEGSSSLGNQAIAGYFTATSSTATNTFAGSLAVGTTSPWGNGLLTVGTSSPLLYVSNSTGNVGIGTTSPDGIFVVRGNGTSDLAEFYSGTGSSVLKIMNSGRIGIGTTTPDATLSILQTANGVPMISAYRATDAAPSGDFISYKTAAGTPLFRVDNSGNLLAGGIINTGSQTITSTSQPQFRVQYDPSNEWTASTNATGGTTFGVNGAAPSLTFIPLSNSANTFNFTNALGTNSILSVDTLNQRVGISNTAPAYTLDITGNGHFTSLVDAANFIATSSSATSLFNGALTVNGNSLFSNATSTNFFATTASSTNLFSSNAQFGSLTTLGNTYLATLGGSVGVGTTSPDDMLEVRSNSAAKAAFAAYNFAGTNTFKITDAGLVGINNAAPAYTLDVAGFINTDQYSGYKQAGITILTASSTTVNTFIGLGVGTSTTSGTWNTFAGYQTGQANTTGSDNTAYGVQALFSNTSGTSNTATGEWALHFNTTGYSNTADGLNALRNNTGGYYNAAIGRGALYSNTTGFSNTAIGRDALYYNITGDSNSAIGYQSLYRNTTGFSNTAIGRDALHSNDIGSYNVAIGDGAAWTSTGDFERNTFIGARTNYNGSSAVVDTTELGYQAGYNNTGWNSTFLGEQSGQNNTSGNNNIAIGFNALVPSPTSDNQLNIGNIIFGTGLTATSSSSSVIPTLTGNIGIASTSPWAQLSVNPNGISGPAFAIGSSTATNFIVTNGGNVGVGTTSPGFKLDVNGIVNATALYVNGTPYIGSQWTTSGSNIYYNTGNIGIGTTSPLARLDVAGANNGTVPLFQLSSVASFATTTQFIVTNNGNVGIGTTSPGSLLSINGIANFSTATSTFYSTGGINLTAGCFSVNGVCTGTGGSGGVGAGLQGQLPFYNAAGTNLTATSTLTLTQAGNFGVGTSTPNWLLQVAGVRPSFALSDTSAGTNLKHWLFSSMGGNLYVGTSTDAYATSTPAAVTILNNGNVGIGTSSPVATLSVVGNERIKTPTNMDNAFTIENASATSTLAVSTLDTSNNIFSVASSTGASYFEITSGGNIGMGVVSPVEKLEVNGAVHLYSATPVSTSMALYNNAGTLTWNGVALATGGSSISGTTNYIPMFTGSATLGNSVLYQSGSNIGVGTTSPGSLLSINGIANFTAATSTFYGTGGINLTNGCFSVNGVCAGTGSGGVGVGVQGQLPFYNAAGTNLIATSTLFLTQAGYFGVGTSSPDDFMEVRSSNASVATAAWYNAAGTNTFKILDNGNIGIGTSSPIATLSVVGNVRIKTPINTATAFVIENASATSSLAVSTIDDNSDILSIASSTGVSYLEVTSGGNIGMGVVVPLSTLDVNGGVAVGAYAGLNAAPTNGLIVSGNVGVGTSTPGTLLSIGGAGTGINFVDGTTATSTISGNLYVKGTLRAAISYVGDLIFSNGFRFVEGDASSTVQSLNLQNQFGTPAITFTDNGNVGIGTTTPNHTLTVAGDVGAIAFVNTSTRDAKKDIELVSAPAAADMLNQLVNLQVATYRYKIEDQSDPLRLGFIAEDAQQIAPEILSPDGKGVDLYKLATFTLAGVQTLAAKVDAQDVRLTSLETRVAKLDGGAVSSASGSPITLGTTSLASALSGFGVLIEKGIAQFNTLVFRQLVASTDTNGTSSAGSVSIITGNTVAQVNNSLVLSSTKVFVTFNSQITGTWWVSDKTNGSFRVVLSAAQAADVSFDYFLVQTQGQMATSTPDGSFTGAPSVSQSNGPDTVPPIITLLGDNPTHVSVGSTFAEPGVTVTDAVDGTDSYITFIDGVQKEVSASTISTASPTTYVITYKATDAAGNNATAMRSVIVGNPDGTVTNSGGGSGSQASTDKTPPVVTLTGAAAMQLTVGGTFIDPGATATDAVDGNLTSSIKETGTVDATTAGSYTLTYTATDAAKNVGTASLTVIVAAAPVADTTAPVVTLAGAATMSLTVGDTFTDPGATATDAVDGNLTSSIKVTGTVDPTTAGSYTLTYTATDAAKNVGTASRTVTVVASPTSNGG